MTLSTRGYETGSLRSYLGSSPCLLLVGWVEGAEHEARGHAGDQFGDKVDQRRPGEQPHGCAAQDDGGLNAPPEIPPTLTAPTRTVKPIASP